MCWHWLQHLIGRPLNFSSPLSSKPGRMATHEDYGVEKLSDHLYDFQSCKKGEENVILLFIHGIALDEQTASEEIPFKTWAFEESKICWPSKLNDLFKEDTNMKKEKDDLVVRALTVKYDASKFKTHDTGRFDLVLLGENFNLTVIPELVTKGKKIPIILVAHSFGGFVIPELIREAFKTVNGYSPQRQFAENLEGMFFYSTPFEGLRSKTYDHFFPEVDKASGVKYSKLVQLLKQQNEQLARDRESFIKNIAAIGRKYRGDKGIKTGAILEMNETVMKNWTGKIVKEASARHVSENLVSLPYDHFGVCKLRITTNNETMKLEFADSVTDLRYTLLRDFIKKIVLNSNESAGPSSSATY